MLQAHKISKTKERLLKLLGAALLLLELNLKIQNELQFSDVGK